MGLLYSELQKLHKKFVLGNILQESEFWATRKVKLAYPVYYYFNNNFLAVQLYVLFS
jgi:hypothetical protein